MAATKQLLVATDFHSMDKIVWKSTATNIR